METNSNLRTEARKKLKGNWSIAMVITFVFSSLATLLACAPYSYPLLFFLFIPALSWSYLTIFLKLVQGEKIDTTRVIQGFTDYARITGTLLLAMLYVLLWSMLFIIPGWIKVFSYAMTPYILADHPELKYNAAINESISMMKGHKMKFFLLQLSFFGWGFLCLFTFGIGFLFLFPYIDTSNAMFYENLKSKQDEHIAIAE